VFWQSLVKNLFEKVTYMWNVSIMEAKGITVKDDIFVWKIKEETRANNCVSLIKGSSREAGKSIALIFHSISKKLDLITNTEIAYLKISPTRI